MEFYRAHMEDNIREGDKKVKDDLAKRTRKAQDRVPRVHGATGYSRQPLFLEQLRQRSITVIKIRFLL